MPLNSGLTGAAKEKRSLTLHTDGGAWNAQLLADRRACWWADSTTHCIEVWNNQTFKVNVFFPQPLQTRITSAMLPGAASAQSGRVGLSM
jgi:hypothetical protein